MNRNKLWCMRACSVSLLFYASGVVGAADLPTEMDMLSEIPMVSSVTRLAQRPEDSPASVTVIDRDMIRASGFINLADLFRLVPGFHVAHISGNQFAVNSHGYSDNFPRRLLVMIDGRSVYTPVFSSVDWLTLPLEIEDIERIEVARGPNVTSHGSNAFEGVINIITRSPIQDQGVYLKATGGSRDTGIGLFRYGGKRGDFEYRVSGSYREDEGFDDPIISDDVEIGKLTFRGNYQLNVRDRLDLQLGAAEGTYGIAEFGDIFDPARDREVDSSFGYLRWDRALSPSESFYIQFYYNYLDMEDTFLIHSQFGTITHGIYNTHAERFDLEFQHTLQPRDDLRLAWGGSLRDDNVGGRYWFEEDKDEVLKRLFANAEWQATQRLLVNAGAMIEDGEIVDTQLSPRLGLNYHLIPNHTLRASVSRAYRLPSLFEEHQFNTYRLDGEVTPVLVFRSSTGIDDPEQMTSYELGYVGHWPRQALTLDIKLYREEIENVIGIIKDERPLPDLDPFDLDQDVFYFTEDIGDFNINGIEMQLSYRPGPSTFLAFQYAYAHTTSIFLHEITSAFHRPSECPQVKQVFDGVEYTPRCKAYRQTVPEQTYGLLGSYRFDSGWETSLGVYGMSPMTWRGDGDDMPSYTRVDGRIARSFRVGGSEVDVSLVLQNLGEDYEEFREDNVFETRAYLQFGLSLP